DAPPGSGRRLTVLHLVTNSLPNDVAGYTTRTHGLLSAQRAAGTDAHAATRIGYPVTRGHLAVQAVEHVDDVPYHRVLATVPLRADRALAKDVERTARLVERIRPDVLHAHSNHLNAQVALALRVRLGLPVVYEVRGFLEETERSRRGADALPNERQRLTRAVETRCMRAADAVITISEVMREAIVARGIAASKVHVVPNSVGDQFLAPGRQEARGSSAAEARGGVSRPRYSTTEHGGPVTVGAVGTLNDYEGLDVLIDAIALLSPGTAQLLVVGDGPARPALEARARAAGIDAEFTGRVSPDRAVEQHQRIDLHATPRLDLPVTRLVPPIKPVEAMALGRAVVVSDLPPLRELVRDSHNGRLVPAGDARALAGVLAELAAAPDVRRRLGANGRADVLANRTWERAAQTCARVYDEIRTGPTPAGRTSLIEGVTS
ncbi:glycosyltransferase family 4 protein, partial [Nocardioides jensenii]|uniref:glycosyltransferase family 4 protein n=1 Tax=Nocardioides jensenii TaxID=1843 RepID=UPI000832A149